ncbi:MAG: hypothetical protein IT245_04490 [Bacteroidia bacterium]|nr:hypothetical protein [Bacteroidia bacterium]
MLFIWFGISIVFKINIKINDENLPKIALKLLKFVRPLSNFTIITGAIFKYLHLPFGNIILAFGLLCLAIYFTLLSVYGHIVEDKPNDIIDNQDL